MTTDKKKFQTGNVITISIAHMVHDTYGSFLSTLLPLLIDKLGITLVMAGMLDVIRKIPSLANPFIGLLADRICMRYMIIFAPTVAAISMSLLGAAPNFGILALLLFMAGIGSTLFHIPSPVLIKQTSAEQIGKGMSFYMLGGESARTLGPLTILGAVSLWGLEGTYRLIPLGVIMSVVLYYQVSKIDSCRSRQKKTKISATHTAKRMVPFFTSIGGFLFFRAGMKSALTIYLPTYLTSKGESLWLAGIALAILQFSGAAGTLLAGSLSDKLGRKKVLTIVAVISPFLMFLFLKTSGMLMVPVLILTGFFLFAPGPVLLALVHEHDSEHMSFINSIYMTISLIITTVTVLSVGWLADHFGLDISYLIMAIGAVFSVPFAVFMKTAENIHEI